MGELANKTLIFQFQPPFGLFLRTATGATPSELVNKLSVFQVSFQGSDFQGMGFRGQVRGSCQVLGVTYVAKQGHNILRWVNSSFFLEGG